MFKIKHLLILLCFVICTTLLSQPTYFLYDPIEAGSVSEKNIYSPKNLSYTDEEATEVLVQNALSEVENSYNENPEVYQNVYEKITSFTDSVKNNQEIITKQTEELKKENRIFDKGQYINSLKDFNSKLGFKDEQMRLFMNMTGDDLSNVGKMTVKLDEMFKSLITEDNVIQKKSEFTEYALKLQFSDQQLQNLIVERFANEIVPNLVLDEIETQKRKQEAIKNVKMITVEIKKNQRIVQKGEIVSEEQVDQLTRLGLLKSQYDYAFFLKQLPFIFMLYALFYLYIMKFYEKDFIKLKTFVFSLALIFVVYVTNDLINETPFALTPFITAIIIFAVFWGRKFTVFASVILSTILFIGDDIFVSLAAISGIILTFTFDHTGKRLGLITSGVYLGLAMSVSHFVFYFAFGSINFEVEINMLISLVVSSATAAVLSSGLLIPLSENFLGLVTAARLHELNDQDHELLKRLVREAPGTYHHSLMVGNLAEQAADEIGADGLLLKVGALYHDVGKMLHTDYFVENLRGKPNPHDATDPVESAQIIRQHPLDSAKLCKEYKVPAPIIDLIIAHHGDSVLYQFYNKAVEQGKDVSIEEFRYKTPIPKTKEQGILLLADSVEAYSRVLFENGVEEEKFKEEIRNLIFKKIEHGQLRKCQLTFEELEIIIQTFTDFLLNTNHKRVPYNK